MPSADPLYESSWYLDAIRAPESWKTTMGSRSTTIAVIDSGADYNHPELNKSIKRNEADCDFDGRDSDRNGFVDDCVGWNFSEEMSLPWDDTGHGTFIGGIISGELNNGLGTSGVCPNCSLLPIRFMDSDGLGDTEDAIRGIKYAVKMGVSVINLSFAGEGYDQELRNALKEALAKDIVVVAAAGNDGENNDKNEIYPANYKLPNLISVAASKKDTNLWAYSNYGLRRVQIAAPGVNVWGPWIDGKWYRSQGTSFATPIVAGAAGLIRSANPNLTAAEVVSIIEATVSVSDKLSKKVKFSGILDLRSALDCAVSKGRECLTRKSKDQESH